MTSATLAPSTVADLLVRTRALVADLARLSRLDPELPAPHVEQAVSHLERDLARLTERCQQRVCLRSRPSERRRRP